MGRIAKNFDSTEFACKCGCGFDAIRAELAYGLQLLRDRLGKSIRVTSGCRCPKHNLAVGGSANSQHVLGYAADIVVAGETPRTVARIAETIPTFRDGGIGVYKSWVHVDARGHRARWKQTED